MKTDPIIERALKIIHKRGKTALEDARQEILHSKYDGGIISAALNYYANWVFPRVLPTFPAINSMMCELAGGDPEKTRPLAAAMFLITASGDIHDDIIDKSTHKLRRKTVFGKYGGSITLLAGDALLVYGTMLFRDRCDSIIPEKSKTVTDLLNQSFFEIAKAEALETKLWKKARVTPKKHYETIQLKGGVAELQCRIGAIIGGAEEKTLASAADYGRLIGVLSTMNDEFVDMYDFYELQHRIKNELPPYPMICALQNDSLKKLILPIIEKPTLTRKDASYLSKIVMNSNEVQSVRDKFKSLTENEIRNNYLLRDAKKGKAATVLLQALALNL